MNYEKQQLEDGYAYLQINQCDSTDPAGNQLVSSNGSPMIKIKWRAVDLLGNIAILYDYVPASAEWKYRNIENALGIRGLYDTQNKLFNTSILGNAHCAAVIKKDANPKYGSKIVTYIPLVFLETVQQYRKKETIHPASEMPTQAQVFVGGKAVELDDDIPF